MIERSFDVEWWNTLCNLPEVRPGLGGEGPIDVSALILNPLNYALRTSHGGFILVAHGAGVYSVHTQFSSEGRGAHAIEAMRAGLEWMFTRTDCMKIYSHCPDNSPPALALAKAGGARVWFQKQNDPLLGPGAVVAWDILDWMVKADETRAAGRAFHDMLEAAKTYADSPLPTHPDDPDHDGAAGAAALMCQRGRAQKGVVLYNLWAEAANYAPIQLLSEAPPTVDVGDGIVGLNNAGEMEVLLCR